MSPIADRLHQVLVIERDTEGAETAWNKPALTSTDLATVMGWVQERSGHEVTAPGLRGTAIADALVFLPSGTDVTHADRIRTTTGRRYELLAVREAGGRTDRGIQADARRIS
jgi:hypothetical protein